MDSGLFLASLCLIAVGMCCAATPAIGDYPDGRPTASMRMDAKDQGPILKHGAGPDRCDWLGMREAIVFAWQGTYYLHYDGAGDKGWLACLATSKNLTDWMLYGPALELGEPGTDDCGSASSPWTVFDGKSWHMFYVATPNTTPPPGRIPAIPYMTRKATARSPQGPWTKQRNVIPFTVKPNTYYSHTASPGQVVQSNGEYLMFFSAAMASPGGITRTLSIARTRDLDGAWSVDEKPILPTTEQIENSALYFEKSSATWFLFTNHIGLDSRGEYTDAIWVYWSKDLQKWDPANKAVVLDKKNCAWSPDCIGMPSVVQVGRRLALLYDGPGGHSVDHLNRDIGLAWLDLPLKTPR